MKVWSLSLLEIDPVFLYVNTWCAAEFLYIFSADLHVAMGWYCCVALQSNHGLTFPFLPEASFGLRVLSLPASVCVCVRQPRACPCHKSPRMQARTTKFGQKVQNNLVKVPIVFGGDWPWPSRSNLTWKAKFTTFWACPCHNSPSIQARTTKFGQKMQTNLLVAHIVFGGDWLRPSWSNLTR